MGPFLGYFPEPTKSWLIVKPEYLVQAVDVFAGTGINITDEGRKHLGAVIGSEKYKVKYVNEQIDKWVEELSKLADIALIEPHAVYAAFTHGYKHKFTYIMRTIDGISNLLIRLDVAVDKLLQNLFFGHDISLEERIMFSLPVKMGGLGFIIPSEISETQYNNSKSITSSLSNTVVEQTHLTEEDRNNIKTRKNEVKREAERCRQVKLREVKEELSEEKLKSLELISEQGASSWLSTLPLHRYDFHLEKQAFWDGLRLRYGIPLSKIPLHCVCGISNSVDHAFNCKRGGFVTIRHNDIRDFTCELLNEVCYDVEVEPLTGEIFNHLTANTSQEARCDVSARGVWNRGQKAYVDVRVFNPIAKCYRNKSTTAVYRANEQLKKRAYNHRILEVENATFTPLVFSCFGGQGYECKRFFQRVNEKLSEKRNISPSISMTYIRAKLSFSLLRSALLCLRGSRSLKKKNVDSLVNTDIAIAIEESQL